MDTRICIDCGDRFAVSHFDQMKCLKCQLKAKKPKEAKKETPTGQPKKKKKTK